MKPAIIESRRLTKLYTSTHPPVVAVSEVSVVVSAGDLLLVTGASGSGKSTLLNLLGCLDRPSAGSVIFDGVDTSTLGGDQVARLRGDRLGFVFQRSQLLAHLTALENVLLPFVLAGQPSDISRAQEALHMVHLEHRAGHRPAQLSGGEQQRVAVARALVRSPDVILADEPTGGLDHETGRMVLSLLIDAARAAGGALVIATHAMELVTEPHRRVHLSDGKVVACDTR